MTDVLFKIVYLPVKILSKQTVVRKTDTIFLLDTLQSFTVKKNMSH